MKNLTSGENNFPDIHEFKLKNFYSGVQRGTPALPPAPDSKPDNLLFGICFYDSRIAAVSNYAQQTR